MSSFPWDAPDFTGHATYSYALSWCAGTSFVLSLLCSGVFMCIGQPERQEKNCVLLQNEVSKTWQDTGNSSLKANVNIKLVFHFFFLNFITVSNFSYSGTQHHVKIQAPYTALECLYPAPCWSLHWAVCSQNFHSNINTTCVHFVNKALISPYTDI